MNIFLGYIAFTTVFMAVGCIVLYALEKLIVFSYEQLTVVLREEIFWYLKDKYYE